MPSSDMLDSSLDLVPPSSSNSNISHSQSDNEKGKRRSRRISQNNKELFKKELDEYLENNEVSVSPKTPSSSVHSRDVTPTPPIVNEHFSVTLHIRNTHKSFTEPKLADPTPSVTGFPLDAFPSQKIKKESLWPKSSNKCKKNLAKSSLARSNSNSSAISRPETATESLGASDMESSREQSFLELPEIEERYKSQLKTSASEKITKPSLTRTSIVNGVHPVSKKNDSQTRKRSSSSQNSSSNPSTQELVDPPSTPLKFAPADLNISHETGLKKNKRIKFSSPKKPRENPFGYGAPPDLTGKPRQAVQILDSNTKDNEDFCSACGEPGIFLCCESCPKSFHFTCCDPPFDSDSLPEDEWYCRECYVEKSPVKTYKIGMFSKLMNQQERRNPVQFRLPKKIREAFEGVRTGKFGEYDDFSMKSGKPMRAGKLEEYDPLRLFDKDGNPLLCYKCGLSGIHGKQITSCDFCPLAWHLDCLDPPLAVSKTLGLKWKCPAHSSDLIPKKRRLKTAKILDVSVSRGFKNDGSIEILHEEDENDDRFQELSQQIHELPTPNFFNSHNTSTGVAAPVSKEMLKTLVVDSIIYRIPERGIILDFIDSAQLKKKKLLDELHKYNEKALTELDKDSKIDEESKNGVKNLLKFKEKPTDKTLNFYELLQIASSEYAECQQSAENDRERRGEKNQKIEDIEEEEVLSKDDMTDLLYIKKLMELKGKDALLEFLKSDVSL